MQIKALTRACLLAIFLSMTLGACNDSGGDGDSDASGTKVYY